MSRSTRLRRTSLGSANFQSPPDPLRPARPLRPPPRPQRRSLPRSLEPSQETSSRSVSMSTGDPRLSSSHARDDRDLESDDDLKDASDDADTRLLSCRRFASRAATSSLPRSPRVGVRPMVFENGLPPGAVPDVALRSLSYQNSRSMPLSRRFPRSSRDVGALDRKRSIMLPMVVCRPGREDGAAMGQLGGGVLFKRRPGDPGPRPLRRPAVVVSRAVERFLAFSTRTVLYVRTPSCDVSMSRHPSILCMAISHTVLILISLLCISMN